MIYLGLQATGPMAFASAIQISSHPTQNSGVNPPGLEDPGPVGHDDAPGDLRAEQDEAVPGHEGGPLVAEPPALGEQGDVPRVQSGGPQIQPQRLRDLE